MISGDWKHSEWLERNTRNEGPRGAPIEPEIAPSYGIGASEDLSPWCIIAPLTDWCAQGTNSRPLHSVTERGPPTPRPPDLEASRGRFLVQTAGGSAGGTGVRPASSTWQVRRTAVRRTGVRPAVRYLNTRIAWTAHAS